jgi:hypothetical protein
MPWAIWATCYTYGYGIPRDLVKSRQLHITATGIAERRALRVVGKSRKSVSEFARRFVENGRSRAVVSWLS